LRVHYADVLTFGEIEVLYQPHSGDIGLISRIVIPRPSQPLWSVISDTRRLLFEVDMVRYMEPVDGIYAVPGLLRSSCAVLQQAPTSDTLSVPIGEVLVSQIDVL
jgi:hypothetical protein